jgi:prevent-host-death family protein
MRPLRIGIREAKINLSKLLKNVQKGKEIILTDRDKPVGKIVPMPTDSLPLAERVRELERQGWIEPHKKKTMKKLLIPIPIPDELAQKFLQEDRNQ